MVAMKINRFDLLEVSHVAIRCRKCGCGLILDVEQACSVARRCPSCGVDFGSNAEECFRRLQDAHFAAKAASDKFKIEFDIKEDVQGGSL